MLAFIGGIGVQELVIIFLIVLLIFGGKKIPEIARGLGKGMREFKRARDEIRDSIDKNDDDTQTATATVTEDDEAKSGDSTTG